jgi:hypothetical protein
MRWAALFVLLAVLIPSIAATATVEAANPQGNTAKAAYKMHLDDSRTVTVGDRGEVWFKWRANTSGLVEVSTCTTNYDTILWAYTGSPGSWTQVGFSDNGAACYFASSIITFLAEKGTVYYFLVKKYPGGWPGVGTTLTLNLGTVVVVSPLP